VRQLTPDTTDPRLVRFVLERPRRLLHLFFSEAVNKTSLRVGGLSLIVNVALVSRRMALATARQVPTDNAAQITLNLTAIA
jgi:hypothetical protein